VLELVQEPEHEGVSQHVHVLVPTYDEPADLVNEGLLRLLLAPAPRYMDVHVYVCDDGAGTPEGVKKAGAVQLLRRSGRFPICALRLPILSNQRVVGASACSDFAVTLCQGSRSATRLVSRKLALSVTC
jgi:hypothetical protein